MDGMGTDNLVAPTWGMSHSRPGLVIHSGLSGADGKGLGHKTSGLYMGKFLFYREFPIFFQGFFFFSIITQMGEIFSNFLLKSKYRKWYLLGGKTETQSLRLCRRMLRGCRWVFCKSLETAATQLATKDVNWLGLFFSWNSSTGGKLVLWIGGLRFWGVPLSNNPFHKGMQKSKPPTQTTNLPLAIH